MSKTSVAHGGDLESSERSREESEALRVADYLREQEAKQVMRRKDIADHDRLIELQAEYLAFVDLALDMLRQSNPKAVAAWEREREARSAEGLFYAQIFQSERPFLRLLSSAILIRFMRENYREKIAYFDEWERMTRQQAA